VDWRDSTDYSKRGEKWARFTDTSAYFIEVLLMDEAGIDTDYNPDLTPVPEPSSWLMLLSGASFLTVLYRQRPR
jgi:hypothetical protein